MRIIQILLFPNYSFCYLYEPCGNTLSSGLLKVKKKTQKPFHCSEYPHCPFFRKSKSSQHSLFL